MTRRRQESLDQFIASAVRKALAGQLPSTKTKPRASGRRKTPEATRNGGPAEPGRAPEGSTAAAPTPAPRDPRAGADLIEKVREQLALSFEGKAVAPSRIAALLKLDVALVDATLTYLVTRKEAQAVWTSGRSGYVPVGRLPSP